GLATIGGSRRPGSGAGRGPDRRSRRASPRRAWPRRRAARAAGSRTWESLPDEVDHVARELRFGRAGGAQAPVDDLGLVDRVAVVVGGGQAGCLADRAGDVGDGSAGPADEVMVVVADAALEPGRAAGRLDAADESR